ncbi:hypothetical protein [Actinomadura sp. NPDC000600]|uniref:5-methylcytosine restriction system specificity protein McrC n=1 Tax=Actinomadura sp. NPDC000600 TaxID=3154262 RepID=UPI0033994917
MTRLMRDAFSGTSVIVRDQEALPGAIRGESSDSYTEIRPDIQLVQGRRLCSVDAKYKLYAEKQVSSSDLFQSFAYAQAAGGPGEPPRAFIVYASDRGMPPKTVGLHRRDGGVVARVTHIAVDIPKVLHEETAREAWFDEVRNLMARE